MIKNKKILIATGGTGGHVYPAYSLVKKFQKENYNVKLTTDRRGLKYLKDYKYLNLITISSSPLVKKNIVKFLSSIFKILFGIFRSLILLISDRPSIIIGMGGYTSFPICIAAIILRIKFVIYENNLIIGKANKYLLPFTKKIFVSFKDIEGISKKYNNKILEIGNIVREEIINSNIEVNKKDSFNDIKILVLGGSQGAKIFADQLPQIFRKIENSKLSIKVFQQCQQEQNDQLLDFYKKAKIDCKIFNFTSDIIYYYSKVNLVITRSGASALGELINMKIPFISIPLPTSADNHQLKNALFYKKKGFGYLVEEKDINNQLYDLIKSIFQNRSLIENILVKQRQYSDKDFFKIVNFNIEKIIYEKN
ncbi:undecaprenyldiphospho-muramoylpentapeptide beta-N-acetylglucosaminyltransferase [Pelagibacteraceae bacterium]|jgi:UDP-N-acetylglucosamine--N-acetylmuramyl-(pentapeptide) pyrophosphoryl-undecaprenol N-acetylglucosamine transferase|nr:undecaprenyldiphospho-muramoylpentapeptide beta-N-acetylglucosaminyltransferase [Pelagibacteraceae bacterium]